MPQGRNSPVLKGTHEDTGRAKKHRGEGTKMETEGVVISTFWKDGVKKKNLVKKLGKNEPISNVGEMCSSRPLKGRGAMTKQGSRKGTQQQKKEKQCRGEA